MGKAPGKCAKSVVGKKSKGDKKKKSGGARPKTHCMCHQGEIALAKEAVADKLGRRGIYRKFALSGGSATRENWALCGRWSPGSTPGGQGRKRTKATTAVVRAVKKQLDERPDSSASSIAKLQAKFELTAGAASRVVRELSFKKIKAATPAARSEWTLQENHLSCGERRSGFSDRVFHRREDSPLRIPCDELPKQLRPRQARRAQV